MEKYDRVVKKKEERTIDANEIRITSMGRARNYITYAMTLLQVLYLLFWACCYKQFCTSNVDVLSSVCGFYKLFIV